MNKNEKTTKRRVLMPMGESYHEEKDMEFTLSYALFLKNSQKSKPLT